VPHASRIAAPSWRGSTGRTSLASTITVSVRRRGAVDDEGVERRPDGGGQELVQRRSVAGGVGGEHSEHGRHVGGEHGCTLGHGADREALRLDECLLVEGIGGQHRLGGLFACSVLSAARGNHRGDCRLYLGQGERDADEAGLADEDLALPRTDFMRCQLA